MLDVDKTQKIIISHFVEGMKIRAIARKLGIHRNTVRSRIEEYANIKKNISTSAKSVSGPQFLKYLDSGTTYDSSTRKPRILTDEISDRINACLAENEIKRLDGRRKQQLRKIDIHEILVESGFAISYSSVCKYVSQMKKLTQEAYIKQQYAPGQACEFDWGEVHIFIDGTRYRYYMAVFTSSYSNYRYAILYERQHSLAYRESHIDFFDHVGAVWKTMTYDNMRVAVAKFVGKTEKLPTKALQQLSRWYLMEWRFCNTARGNEKGHVERSVEFIRRKTFAFKDSFESFQEAQQYLLDNVSILNKRVPDGALLSPYDRLQQERQHLLPNPGRMECFDGENCKVDKYSTISLGTIRYSVPDRLCGKIVFTKIYSSHLLISDDKDVACRHTRSYDRNSWHLNLNHYLVTLSRKPGALHDSVSLTQSPNWLQTVYRNHFKQNSRGFVELLQYCQTNDISLLRLKATIDKQMSKQPNNVDVDHIIALLGNQLEKDVETEPTICPNAIATQSMENLVELAAMMG